MDEPRPAFSRLDGLSDSHRHRGRTICNSTPRPCVDDPASFPAYNTITSREKVGERVSAESMRSMLYRRGLLLDYPTNAAARAGSCIFVHVWRSPEEGTLGCIALLEERIAALQDFVARHSTALAIVPAAARDRLAACLPAVDAESR
jgi:hypothetical protein